MENEANAKAPPPPGIRLLEYTTKARLTFKSHQAIVLIVTFLAYSSYHATRKTSSIIKSSLDPTSTRSPTTTLVVGISSSSGGWAPFNGANGTELLGDLDLGFLFVYAMGMFLCGHIGDRMNLRIFLTLGMLGTGVLTSLFGVGYWANIHSFYYYLIVQMLAGLFQSTGWPSVVAVVGNWFGKTTKRGLIMGIWNAHTSIGNISGSLMASYFLKYGWGWSMVVPGFIITLLGLLVFLLLPVDPQSVGSVDDDDAEQQQQDKPFLQYTSNNNNNNKKIDITKPLLNSIKESPVGFMEAWKIPGVAPYAFCLFFAKLVAYTFLYWLPFYISHTAINGEYLSNEAAGNLSTLFDIGGVVGGILAGHISDRLNARAITAATFMYCAIPALYLYRNYGHISVTINVVLMLVTGIFVNGPYALITTAVSTDLGTHRSLRGNSRALATVTAIIDGTGSIGAAIGPLLTGYISTQSWTAVFTMLMVAAFVAGLFLTRLVVAEISTKWQDSRHARSPAAVEQV